MYRKNILGLTINRLEIDDEYQHYLRFTGEDETHNAEQIIWEAEGDCCSETWFAEINNIDALLGRKILRIRELDMEKELTPEVYKERVNDGQTRQEYDHLYGIELQTDGGSTLITFRNSSNGYYGGGYNEINAQQKNFNKTLEKILWKNLTEDYPT